MNSCHFIGNLGKDPDLTTSQDGLEIAKFPLAVKKERKVKEGESDTLWLNVVVFGKSAGYVGDYVTKGMKVAVVGRLEHRKYENRDGNERDWWEVIADRVENLTPREKTQGGTASAAASSSASDPRGRNDSQTYADRSDRRPAPRATPPPPSPDEYDPFGDD